MGCSNSKISFATVAEARTAIVEAVAASIGAEPTAPRPHVFARCDDGTNFIWATRKGDVVGDIPNKSARAKAERTIMRMVRARDVADTNAQQGARTVQLGWLKKWTKQQGITADMTTSDVVAQHIQPATQASRCRYVELPEVVTSKVTGNKTCYVIHCWEGRWLDLIAGLSHVMRDEGSVWIDVLAVCQVRGFRGSNSNLLKLRTDRSNDDAYGSYVHCPTARVGSGPATTRTCTSHRWCAKQILWR